MTLWFSSFLIFLVILAALLFVHEFGHFITAKRLGITVEEFGFGFPPRLAGVVRDASGKLRWVLGPKAPNAAEVGGGRTVYSINAIPFGAFVRLGGEDDPLVPGSMAGAPKRARIAVLAAGPVFNLAFALLVFIVGFMVGWPEQTMDRVAVMTVAQSGPAATAGLLSGDVILRMDDQPVHTPDEATAYIYSHLGQPVTMTLERDGQTLERTVTPRTDWPEGQGPTGIVLTQPYTVVQYSLPQATVHAVRELGDQVRLLLELPGYLLRQGMAAVRPIGVVGLNDVTRETVAMAQEINQWFPVLQLIGQVSVGLAAMNLLPLPALDGGRILFVLIEAIRGRRLDPARENVVHLVGMAMLLVLMVVITYQDLVNPVVPR